MFEHPERRRVYLMRHAEAEYVRPDGSVAPDERVVPLTALGREQARSQAHAVSGIQFDRAICSGLPRTKETAGIILEAHPELVLEERSELVEIAPGGHFDIDDLSPAEQAAVLKGIANPWAEAVDPDGRFLGGERFGDFAERVIPAWQAILEDRSWKTILMVLHGAVNRLILNHVLNTPWQAGVSIEQDNACLNIIDVDHAPEHRTLLRLVNFTNYSLNKEGIWLTNLEQTAARMAGELASRE